MPNAWKATDLRVRERRWLRRAEARLSGVHVDSFSSTVIAVIASKPVTGVQRQSLEPAPVKTRSVPCRESAIPTHRPSNTIRW